jgi:hypothetical protein
MKALLGVVVVAVAVYFIWSHYFSRTGKIERAYESCVKQTNQAADKARAERGLRTSKEDVPSRDKSTSELGMDWAQEMGVAMCGVIRDACDQDYNGGVCQAAIRKFR